MAHRARKGGSKAAARKKHPTAKLVKPHKAGSPYCKSCETWHPLNQHWSHEYGPHTGAASHSYKDKRKKKAAKKKATKSGSAAKRRTTKKSAHHSAPKSAHHTTKRKKAAPKKKRKARASSKRTAKKTVKRKVAKKRTAKKAAPKRAAHAKPKHHTKRSSAPKTKKVAKRAKKGAAPKSAGITSREAARLELLKINAMRRLGGANRAWPAGGPATVREAPRTMRSFVGPDTARWN